MWTLNDNFAIVFESANYFSYLNLSCTFACFLSEHTRSMTTRFSHSMLDFHEGLYTCSQIISTSHHLELVGQRNEHEICSRMQGPFFQPIQRLVQNWSSFLHPCAERLRLPSFRFLCLLRLELLRRGFRFFFRRFLSRLDIPDDFVELVLPMT